MNSGHDETGVDCMRQEVSYWFSLTPEQLPSEAAEKWLRDPEMFWQHIDTEETPGWPCIVLDFNGVLDTYTGWNGKYDIGDTPAEGVEKFLQELSAIFPTIVVQSAAPPAFVGMWLVWHDLIDYVTFFTNIKVPAAVYVDDRAVVHRGDFDQTYQEAAVFEPYWRK